ncbi:MAG: response regulator, partial [Bdellovibrionales bacterium]|nr:response regulator [Bdellovibrionales bacterium]
SQMPKILYIDDENDLLNLAASFFEDEALPIETCATFSEALIKIRNNTYDLIISDARMPTGSGQELYSIIKNEKLSCGKFILVTGNLDFDEKSEKDNYDLILFKPLRFQDLVDHAKKMLKL